MSLRKPINGPMSQRFGNDFISGGVWYYKSMGQLGHNGNDYAADEGTPVYAAADGVVDFEGDATNDPWTLWYGGIYVRLRHDDCFTGYAHLSSTVIDKGQQVARGQLIGYSGSTGAATGPHLHFECIALKPNINNGYAGRFDPNPYIVESQTDQQVNATPAGGTVDTIKSMYWRLLGREADQDGINTYSKAADEKGWQFVYNDLKNSDEGQRDWQRRSPDAVKALEDQARNSQAKVATLERQLSEAQAALTNAANKPPEVVVKEVEKIVTKEVPVYTVDEQTRASVANTEKMVASIKGSVAKLFQVIRDLKK